ncbi:MAG: TetR/AcrR family transcriptional regulator [Adlercreutzia equolifaciens]
MICAGHFAEKRRGVPGDDDGARLWEDDAAAGGRLRTERRRDLEGIAAPDRHAGRDCGHGAQALRAERGAGDSIASIAKEANVTRELIYYHFANRNGLIEAVIDDYVEDLVESVIVWNEARVFGDTSGSLKKCIRTFRYSLYDGTGRPRPMIGVLEELGVRDAFDVRATRETADCLANHIAKEYAAYHRIEIELVHEMFCVVIFGLVGLVKMNPRIEDDVLMKVTEQTLRLDMAPLEAGEG